MDNDLSLLPWRPNQLIRVENYWEAAGVLSALKAGINPRSVRRPLANLEVKTGPQMSALESKTYQQKS